MSKNNVMDDLHEMICDELECIQKKGALDTNSLNILDKLVDIKKDILEIQAMEDYIGQDNYIRNNGNMYSYSYYPRYAYNRMSYANNYNRYNYSRAENSQEMIQYLQDMARDMSPQKQEAVHQFIEQLEQMN